MSDTNDHRLDLRKRRQSFEKAANTYDCAAVLQREIADRLLQRMDYIKISPARVLDLGAGTGYVCKDVLQRYPESRLVAVDIALNMLKKAVQQRHWLRRPAVVCASAESLPFRNDCFDMVISNLMLQWCEDLPGVFSGIQRVLADQGLLTFTTFGPDTLKELTASWREVDNYAHTSEFVDMHDVGDAMLQAGFQQPVVDMETITVTYPSLTLLMKDLKNIGATNASMGRNPGLTGKQRFMALEKAYEPFRTPEGLYPLTYEVIYGHGWATTGLEGIEGMIPITEIKA